MRVLHKVSQDNTIVHSAQSMHSVIELVHDYKEFSNYVIQGFEYVVRLLIGI